MNVSSRSKCALSRITGIAMISLGLATAVPAAAQEANCPCPPPAPPLWTGSAGLSFLATSGNTDTQSFGLTLNFARQPTPWGLELSALANSAETDGVKTAERTFGGLRGKRALGERWEIFGGLSYERNEFAGFDARTVVEAGGLVKLLSGPRHELALDAGLTYTDEEPVIGDGLDSFGALAGVAYGWKISAGATLRERLLYFPNFDISGDWRFSSETSLDAAIAASWALRVSYLYTRDNLPAPGFEKVDGATAVSIVWKR